MSPADPAAMTRTVQSSALHGKYATAVDRESAREILVGKLEAGAAKAEAEAPAEAEERSDDRSRRQDRPMTGGVPWPPASHIAT